MLVASVKIAGGQMISLKAKQILSFKAEKAVTVI